MRTYLHAFVFCATVSLSAVAENPIKTTYHLSTEPIDVVIPCHEKDARMLPLVIEGIKEHAQGIRRIIVVSANRINDQTEWFNEAHYPFSKLDVACELFDTLEQAKAYINQPSSRIGWIYQQLLKLYAPLVIPDISSNVLVVDADTVFLRPVSFIGPNGEAYFNVGTEYHTPYFEHAKRLIPWLKKVYPQYSGICHHMLFQRPVLQDLFKTIYSYHQIEPWKAILRCIDKTHLNYSSFSEYEIYFNFAMLRSDQMKLRPLKWHNLVTRIDAIKPLARSGFDYASCHSYWREQ